MSDRTMAQRIADDHDHRLQMCGDLEVDRGDLRVRFEREDFEQGKYDFIFASPPAFAGSSEASRRPHPPDLPGGGKAHGPDRPPTGGVVKGRPFPSEGGRPTTFDRSTSP
jgi:hypothetical protein